MARTPKQTLQQHIDEFHKKGRGWSSRLTFEQLGRWHAEQHHRFTPRNHHHAGGNTGAGDRPAGWRTGEDAVSNQ